VSKKIGVTTMEKEEKKEAPIKMIRRLAVNFVLFLILCIVMMKSMNNKSKQRQDELENLQKICETQNDEIKELNQQINELNTFINSLGVKK